MFFPPASRPEPANLEALRAALHAALNSAGEEERPGLCRAIHIVEDFVPSGGPAGEDWARNVLKLAGIDPLATEVKAVRELRRVRPDLSLKEAVKLVHTISTKPA